VCASEWLNFHLREEVESGLRFLGLIIFENKLKPGTTPSIHTLRSARIGVRMCTGDNIRTAISVARECGMVGQHASVYMPAFVSGSETESRSEIEWFDIEREENRLDPYSLKVRPVLYPHAKAGFVLMFFSFYLSSP
jgi:cation-transporting ATPase 13A2